MLFRPGKLEQLTTQAAASFTHVNIVSAFLKAVPIAYRVLLAGFAIGFTFVMFLLLQGMYPGLQIATWGAALVLWISLEYLYRDPVFIFAGGLFLYLVAAIASAALAANMPANWVMQNSLRIPTLYLIGLLTMFRLLRWLMPIPRWLIAQLVRAVFHKSEPLPPDTILVQLK